MTVNQNELDPSMQPPDAVEEANETQPQPPEQKPERMEDDPRYQALNKKLFEKFKAETGLPILTAKGGIDFGPQNDPYFDYMNGPNDPNRKVRTIKDDTEAAFRAEYPDAAQEYDQKEHTRTYDDVQSDPAYKAMDTRALESTNKDRNLAQASRTGKSPSGNGWGATWDSLYSSNHHHALFEFVQQYPEKAAGYAEQWNDYVAEHPDMAEKNGLELGKFGLRKQIAQALEHLQTRRQNDLDREALRGRQHDEEESDILRKEHGIPAPARNPDESLLDSPEQAAWGGSTLRRLQETISGSLSPELRKADRKSLERLKDKLSELPYMTSQETAPILTTRGRNEGSMFVPTDAIVGSVSGAFRNWSTEYQTRAGRIVDVAQSIMKADEASLEEVFHSKNPEQGIQLRKIEGPGGPLFFVVDGTHRVAGSKLAQIPEIPAQVENITEMSEIRTSDGQLASHWRTLIDGGLVSGTIHETEDPSGTKNYELKITKQVLPWISLRPSASRKMTKIYLELYPHGLDGIKSLKTGETIPQKAFTDPIAMNFFLAGKWNKYKEKNPEE